MDTMAYASIVQPLQADMGNYWTPAQSMGDELVAGTRLVRIAYYGDCKCC